MGQLVHIGGDNNEYLPENTAGRSIVSVDENMRSKVQQLIDPRVISKIHNHEGRKEKVQELRKYKLWKNEFKRKAGLAETEITTLDQSMAMLEEQERSRKESVGGRFAGWLDKRSIKEDIKGSIFTEDKGSLDIQREAYQEERERNQKGFDVYRYLGESTLKEFYDGEGNTPLTVEEKQKLLTPEVLSSLSLEQYMLLWKRLNPYFLGHVTRQGFRDHHQAGGSHDGGLEEFSEGFTGVLEDKLIRPPLSIHSGLNQYDKDSIRVFIEGTILPHSNDIESAQKLLHTILWHSWAAAPKYAADTSIHFAKQIIADSTYGGETGNEVFYVFPSDVLASQCNYSFNRTSDFREPQHEEKWNDVFVWPSNEEKNAIELDMGIVFLPIDAQVDPSTGSRYASENVEGELKMVLDEENIQKVEASIGLFRKNDLENDDFESDFLSHMLDQGHTDIPKTLSSRAFSSIKSYLRSSDKEIRDEQIKNILKEWGLLWKLSNKTVDSQEYWEKFFQEYPEKRPQRIVYYSGDPTNAVHKFLSDNGITGDRTLQDKPLLGLEDKHVENMNDTSGKPGYDFLIEVAHKVIDEYYKKAA